MNKEILCHSGRLILEIIIRILHNSGNYNARLSGCPLCLEDNSNITNVPFLRQPFEISTDQPSINSYCGGSFKG